MEQSSRLWQWHRALVEHCIPVLPSLRTVWCLLLGTEQHEGVSAPQRTEYVPYLAASVCLSPELESGKKKY